LTFLCIKRDENLQNEELKTDAEMLKAVQRMWPVKVKVILVSEGDWKPLKLTRIQVVFPSEEMPMVDIVGRPGILRIILP
jgi:hypothetical protein